MDPSSSERSRKAGLGIRGYDPTGLKPTNLPPPKDGPLVSILLSSYNYESYIGQAIQSVLDQTYPNFELIICDDGSTDRSVEVIQPFLEDARIQLIQKDNGGQASALNRAYEEAKGEIICLMDSDDLFISQKLERQVAAFTEAPNCGLCLHKVRSISSTGKIISAPYPRFLESGWIAQRVLEGGGHSNAVPPTVGLGFRREVTDRIFPLPGQFWRSPDAYLVRAAFFITRIVPIDQVLAFYRVHGSNILGRHLPTVQSATIVIEDAERYVEALRLFLKSTYSESLANRLRLENNTTYWNNVLASFLLTGKLRPAVQADKISQVVDRLPRGKNKNIWRVLVRIPRCLARPAFRLWWGRSILKRFVQTFLYR